MFFWNSCFFQDPSDVGNLISGSSAFSKSSLNIWKFMFQVLLKSGLQNFEHYFANLWDECNCAVVWTFFGIAFLWDWNEKTDLFQSCGHCWVFQICWHIECSTFRASSFRIWNSSTGIPFFIYLMPNVNRHSSIINYQYLKFYSKLSNLWNSFNAIFSYAIVKILT